MFGRPRFPAAKKKKSGKKAAGKTAESELEAALRQVPGCEFSWDFNPAGAIPKEKLPGDRIATVLFTGTFPGLSIVFDAKEITLPTCRFDMVRYEPIQRLSAHRNIKSGGAGMLFLQLLETDAIGRARPEKTRAWLTSYQAFELLRSTLGRKSIPLGDADRPTPLIEAKKRKFPNGIETWDLEQALWDCWQESLGMPNPNPRDIEV